MSIGKLTIEEKIFFELLRAGLWNKSIREELFPLNDEQWTVVLKLAKKQALLGNVIDGMGKIKKDHQPSIKIRLQWIAILQKIEQQNEHLNQYAVEVSERFRMDGFRNLILKGQGIASFYTNPLHRQSGDIDIYVEGGRKKVLEYLMQYGVSKKDVVYHHLDFPTPKGEIECHTHCTWFYNPFMNYCLQKKLRQWTEESFDNFISMGEGKIPIPCVEMNQYYILHHIYRHLFSEGIGLRQLCDYAMLMEKTYTKENAIVFRTNLKTFGLTDFAGGVFYILATYLGYPMEKLPVELDNNKFGSILFNEIMLAGNFGQHDPRIQQINHNSEWSKFSQRIKRNLTFLSYFPSEVISTPLFKIWHFVWRKAKGYL